MTVVLWVLAVLLGLLLLLLFCPIRLEVCINSKESFGRIHFLFFHKKLFPSKKEAKQDSSSTPRRTGKKKQKKGFFSEENTASSKQKKGLSERIEMLRLFLDPAPELLRFVAGGIQIKKLRVIWRVSTEDAAETAILYGRACAAASGLLPILQNLFHPKIERIWIYPDFTHQTTAYLVSFQIRFRLYRILFGGIRYLGSVFKRKIQLTKKQTLASHGGV